jgi:phosphoribosylanthranilate isomerase
VSVYVKVCGLTRREDALAAVAAGVDAVGLNFWPGSKRVVEVEVAREIAAALPAGVAKVGVFVNAPERRIADVCAAVGLDVVQLHGDETPELGRALTAEQRRVWRAVRVRDAASLAEMDAWPDDACEAILLDNFVPSYGGSGQPFDWSLAHEARRRGRRIVLAGGLTPENVQSAVREVRPWGVDVAGGVERSPGLKDAGKIARFVAAARGAWEKER